MKDCFMAITLALWVYVLIPGGIVAAVMSWVNKHKQRRVDDRNQRLDS